MRMRALVSTLPLSGVDRSASTRHLGEIHPDLRAAYRRTMTPPVSRWTLPFLRAVPRWMARRARPIDGVTVEEHQTTTAHVRVYSPTEGGNGAALLWIHGGGLVSGTPAMDDIPCSQFAADKGVVVVSPYYRLSPENRFPAALDDCHAAWHWLQHNASRLGVDPARVSVLGGSGGGALAAALVQRVHDEGGTQPAAQVLISAVLDDRVCTDRTLDRLPYKFLTAPILRFTWRSYLGQEPGAATTPQYAVPARRHDLRGLPPTWIGVGDLEPLLDENVDYATRLQDAGVPCHLEVTRGAPHGITVIAPEAPITQDFTQKLIRFLTDHLEPTPTPS